MKRKWTQDEVKGWYQKTGAITYCNKEDLNIVVRKPRSQGYTVNWANPKAWLLQAVILLIVFGVLALTGCNSRSMNHIIQNEPSITGIVKTVTNDAFLMGNETGEYWVSLKVENKDSMTHFSMGDEVVVYFDGNVAESAPMQINRVYAITLKTPADRTENEEP